MCVCSCVCEIQLHSTQSLCSQKHTHQTTTYQEVQDRQSFLDLRALPSGPDHPVARAIPLPSSPQDLEDQQGPLGLGSLLVQSSLVVLLFTQKDLTPVRSFLKRMTQYCEEPEQSWSICQVDGVCNLPAAPAGPDIPISPLLPGLPLLPSGPGMPC